MDKKRTYSGTMNPEVSEREIRNRKIAARAATEGIVLMKNENQVLPLDKNRKVALFGGGACKTIKGGTGSGDVNEREVIGILEGMLRAGFDITTTKWLTDYEVEYDNARLEWKNQILEEDKKSDKHFFDIYSAHSFQVPSGRLITDADVKEADTDTAIYVISRVAGEAADRFEEKGDYYLTDVEYENLKIVCAGFAKVILILNTGSQIDLSYVDAFSNISGILYMSQAGMEGGNALAAILCGEETPSGKLTDTWAYNYQDYPAAATFSHNNGNVTKEYYHEGIYVGYRYFDSFQIAPRYGFGHGLSYTAFQANQSTISVDEKQQIICINTTVKNTGNTYAGKEVMQIYVSTPQTQLHKEFRKLCGFGKTRLLAPEESECVEITFPLKAMSSYKEAIASYRESEESDKEVTVSDKAMASYREAKASDKETEGAWVAEQGLYGIWLGNSLAQAKLIGAISIEKDTIIEQVKPICPVQEEEKKNLKELVCPEEKRKAFEKEWKEQLKKENLPIVTMKAAGEQKHSHVKSTPQRMASELVKKLTKEELIAMTIGEVSKGQSEAANNAIGASGNMVPGAAGETSSILEETYGIPGMPMADGPAGLRLAKSYEVSRETGNIYPIGLLEALEGGIFSEKVTHENADIYYQYCTAIPVGTLLAQTWNTALMQQVGEAIAEEMKEFGVTLWLAPGMNIHRDPLCGRNFEYYAEDPLLSGLMAAYITKGVQKDGKVGTTIKHFACNNQEDNRKGSDSILSERTLREIYLKGFEIAVKQSQPLAIMSSYNLVNGVHTANSKDLCTQAARTEWGFQGIIMTDWTTTDKKGGSIPHLCVKAGNDLIMPGVHADKEDISKALDSGALTIEELQACVERILTIAFQTGTVNQ